MITKDEAYRLATDPGFRLIRMMDKAITKAAENGETYTTLTFSIDYWNRNERLIQSLLTESGFRTNMISKIRQGDTSMYLWVYWDHAV